MARAFDMCMIDLTASGASQDRAKRACMAAFWHEHGMFPEEADQSGFDPGGDLSPMASMSLAELSAPGSDLVGVFAMGPMMPSEDPTGCDCKEMPDQARLTREVQMLAPGELIDATGKVFNFTPEMLQQYADNFDPQDHPPILLDHRLAADAINGRIRSLRVKGSATDPVLFGLWEFLGQDAVDRVNDGRWSRTSGRFAVGDKPEDQVVLEGSIVWRGAYNRGPGDRAQILQEAKERTKNTMKVTGTADQATSEPAVGADQTKEQEIMATIKIGAIDLEPAKLSQPDLVSQDIINKLRADVAILQAERETAIRHADLSECASAVRDLVSCGRALPDMDTEELAILSEMPKASREKYLALRKKLPQAWPAGGRLSEAVTGSAPGQDDAAQLAAFQQLGASMGYFPAPKK